MFKKYDIIVVGAGHAGYEAAAAAAIEITDDNFDEIVLRSNKTVLVDFWAEWCGPRGITGKALEEICREFAGKVIVGRVNVDLNPGISGKYRLDSMPVLYYFKNGQIVDKQVEVVAKAVLTDKLIKYLD